jgi:hypothetical protein
MPIVQSDTVAAVIVAQTVPRRIPGPLGRIASQQVPILRTPRYWSGDKVRTRVVEAALDHVSGTKAGISAQAIGTR